MSITNYEFNRTIRHVAGLIASAIEYHGDRRVEAAKIAANASMRGENPAYAHADVSQPEYKYGGGTS